MTKEWTSLSVTESQKEVIESHKPEGMSMGAFLVTLLDPEADISEVLIDSHSGIDVEELADEIAERLDGVAVDESAIATMVVEDLQAQLPSKIADQLR